MKLYLDQQQTAKLIELGFDKPSSIEEFLELENDWSIGGLKQRKAYLIGELIEMLPKHIFPNGVCFDLHICANQNLWVVKYTEVFYEKCYRFCSKELIDALYDMIVKLKEEGVI